MRVVEALGGVGEVLSLLACLAALWRRAGRRWRGRQLAGSEAGGLAGRAGRVLHAVTRLRLVAGALQVTDFTVTLCFVASSYEFYINIY